MEEFARGCPVEKNLYLAVLDFGRLRILGVFNSLHGRPEPGPHCSVTRIGGTAQPDALFRTLDIRQFGSFDPSGFWPTTALKLSGKYRRNETPHQEPCG